MKKISLFSIFFISQILSPAPSFSQYIIKGNAIQESCNCYLLTSASKFQSGSVWQSKKLDLRNSFDFSFRVYLGCEDYNGADGIVFILETDSNSIGASGQGLGFQGIIPSIGISLDTYQNPDEPPYDHISIQENGNIVHKNDITGPVPASSLSDNIEDCNWHILRIIWNASTLTLATYFDGVFRLAAQKDLTATVFNNNPLVYWGFSGSTGNQFNVQKFCTPLNAEFNTNFSNDATCYNTPITFKDSSISFSTTQNYYWDFGDGTHSIERNPAHNYTLPGIYQVKHSITAADGCTSEQVIRTFSVGDKPNVSFNIYDTCKTIAPRLENNTTTNIGVVSQWNWQLDGNSLLNVQTPNLNNLNAGTHSISLIALTNYGCISNSLTKKFYIKDIPDINITASDGCINAPITFSAQQIDNITTINSWLWNFGDGLSSPLKNTEHYFARKGIYSVNLIATSTNGCSNSIFKNILANEAKAFAGNDTVVLPHTSFWLHGTGGEYYSWYPSTGLSNPKIADPICNAVEDIRYILTVKTPEGCADTSGVMISVFKGSAIYVPTGFTPNNDGLNDVLKPAYIGIKLLSYFTIYNRLGQKVFTTNKMNSGWNGVINGRDSNTGIFVWILKATDLIGRIYI